MIEIERKFLVAEPSIIKNAIYQQSITQGYLNSDPERTVRIRIKKEKAFITIKGKSNLSGTTRFEWEKEIPINEALELLNLCEDYIIEKTRYLIDFHDHTFEVDVFHGDNKGLIIAEIELKTEDENFDRPSWLGVEVTGDVRYYNSYISKNPFKMW